MIKFNKTEINKQKIPFGKGIFTLSGADNILYINKTSSLDKSIRQLFKVAKDDRNIFQLVSQTVEIAFEEHTSLFAALVHQKKLESTSHPEFNSMIKPYEQYVYLGINFDEPPYIKIVEDTQENRFYIGSFKDRFFLFDLLDAMADLFYFPLCPDEKPYPCIRYKSDKCLGWCIKEKHETYTKAILPYIIPTKDLLSSKQKEYDKYFSNLQFEKAEKLKNKIQQCVNRAGKYCPFLYSIGDENSLTSYTRPLDICFSPYCLSKFREWLKREYGNLDNLNKCWETNFSSWDEVKPFTTKEILKRKNMNWLNLNLSS